MRLRRGFVLAVETERARGPDVGEVRALRVHVIVDAEDDDVVLRHEVDFRLVERIAVDDGDVVAIVPERVFVRNDHVEAGRDGALHHVEAAEHRRRDACDAVSGPPDLNVSR